MLSGQAGNAQSIGGSPRLSRNSLALEKWRHPKKPLWAESGDGSGEHARAAALATKFLADYPKSPHVERVKRIAR